jgi:hypothetical protein
MNSRNAKNAGGHNISKARTTRENSIRELNKDWTDTLYYKTIDYHEIHVTGCGCRSLREVSSSNLDRDTDYPDSVFSWFSPASSEKCQDSNKGKVVPVHYAMKAYGEWMYSSTFS